MERNKSKLIKRLLIFFLCMSSDLLALKLKWLWHWNVFWQLCDIWQTKEDVSGTLEAVQNIQSITQALQKSKENYNAKCVEQERLKKEGATQREVEKVFSWHCTLNSWCCQSVTHSPCISKSYAQKGLKVVIVATL